MTGPEFALSIIASMIAAVLYDILRNPSPPVFKDDSKNLLQPGQVLIRKIASKILNSKKEEDARPTAMLENQPSYDCEPILKKSEVAHAYQSFVFAHRAFLKTLAR